MVDGKEELNDWVWLIDRLIDTDTVTEMTDRLTD